MQDTVMDRTERYPGFRWYVLLAVVVGVIAQGMMLIGPTPMVEQIAQQFNMNLGAATGLAMMPFTLLVAIGGIISGILLDKLGVYKTLLGGMAISAIAAVLMPMLGTTPAAVIVLRALQGIGCAPVIASGAKIAAEWFPPKQRGMVQGVLGAALSGGITIGLLSGPQLAGGDVGGWTRGIMVAGVVMAIAGVMFALNKLGEQPSALTAPHGAPPIDMKKVFALPVFWAVFITAFALSWVQQGYNDLTPGHIAVPPPAGLGMGPAQAGQIMGLYTFAFMIGSLVSGFTAEKIFGGKYKYAILTCFILTAIFCGSVLLPVVYTNKTLLIVCLVLAGFFMGHPMPIGQTAISNFYPEQLTGAVGGITMGLAIFGGTIGVAAGSTALGITHAYTISIIIVLVMCVIGAVAALGVNRPSIFGGARTADARDARPGSSTAAKTA